jgi:hypothetical protein
VIELRKHALQRTLGAGKIALAVSDRDSSGDELVVERRDDDLDAVVLDDADALEQVLLRVIPPAAGRVGDPLS